MPDKRGKNHHGKIHFYFSISAEFPPKASISEFTAMVAVYSQNRKKPPEYYIFSGGKRIKHCIKN